jgi:hypothetical protein
LREISPRIPTFRKASADFRNPSGGRFQTGCHLSPGGASIPDGTKFLHGYFPVLARQKLGFTALLAPVEMTIERPKSRTSQSKTERLNKEKR